MRAADLDPSFVPRRTDATWTEVLDGEAVILDDDANLLHHLNTTATVVWTCFDGSGSIAEIAADLAHGFGTDVDATVAEVLALARALGAAGLLDGVEAEPVDPHPLDDGHEAVRATRPPSIPE